MDPGTLSVDILRPMTNSNLDQVRGVAGIDWAVPLGREYLPGKLNDGRFTVFETYAVDDNSLIGAPLQMYEGNKEDLRREDAIIVDHHAAITTLAKHLPDGTKEPLKLGDSLEINDHHALVVGLGKVTLGFYPHPIIITTLANLKKYDPYQYRYNAFILVKTAPGYNAKDIAQNISKQTGLLALTTKEFEWRTVRTFLSTGILLVITILSGFILGILMVGQLFYAITISNLPHFALLKAFGVSSKKLLWMISVQAIFCGFIGFGLGIGFSVLLAFFLQAYSIAYYFPWSLIFLLGGAITFFVLLAAKASISKVIHVDPLHELKV